MKRRNIRCIPGLQLRQQSNLLLYIFNFIVVLVKIKRFDGYDLFGLVMNSSLPSSASHSNIRVRSPPFVKNGGEKYRKKTLSPLVDTTETPFADEFQHRVWDVWRHTGHLLPNRFIRVCNPVSTPMASRNSAKRSELGEADFRAPAGPSLRP